MLIKSRISRLISPINKSPFQFQFLRTFVDNIDIKFVRDRALDHVVEREKDLKTLINLKNLIKLEPSNSLPLSSIIDNNQTLKIPIRPIDFIRKYPNFFEEFFPGNIGIHPHIKLTEKSLDLDSEERLIFDSFDVRKNAADRLLKLLMLCKINEIPINLIDKLKWDLGLPNNYVDSLIPEFPDYFRVKNRKGYEPFIELVCWSDELAVSCVEKMAKKTGKDVEFKVRYSQGFVIEKKFEKWFDEWKKLPYISPYENAVYLQPNSDESDKWAVAVLHELLSLFVGRKSEKDNVVCLSEYLGVRARIKRAMVNHPGIFYVSSKLWRHTVVLRDGFKRGELIEKEALMDMRGKYIHYMHRNMKVEKKSKSEGGGKERGVEKEGEEEFEDVLGETVGVSEDGKEGNETMEVPDESDDEDDESDEDESDEDDEEEGKKGGETMKVSDSDEDESDDDDEEESNATGRGIHGGGRGRGVGRNGRGGFRGGGRSGSRGFDRGSETGQERGGRRGFNEVNRGRGGGRGRGVSRASDGQDRGGSRSGGRGGQRDGGARGRSGGRGGRSGYGKVYSSERSPKRSNESRKFA